MLVQGDAAAQARGEQGGVDGRGGSVGAILDAEALGAEPEALGGGRGVTKRASPTGRLGGHKGQALESTHVLQPGEETLRGGQGDGSERREEQSFGDAGQGGGRPGPEPGAAWSQPRTLPPRPPAAPRSRCLRCPGDAPWPARRAAVLTPGPHRRRPWRGCTHGGPLGAGEQTQKKGSRTTCLPLCNVTSPQARGP